MKIAITSLALLIFANAAAAVDTVKEGQWQYTMQMQMPDMPKVQMPPNAQLPPGLKLPQMGPAGMTMTFERCVTEADLVPRSEHDDRCKITQMERRGNTVQWSASCDTPNGKMNGEGTATYTRETMNSKMRMTGNDRNGKPIDMTQNITGRYIGSCPKQ